MKRNLLYIILIAAFALGTTSCKKEQVTDEARQQADQSVGEYTVEGNIDLYPYIIGDTEHKVYNFSGVATIVDDGDASLAITYVSDKTGDANSITADVDADGNISFDKLTVSVDGITGTASTLSSTICRHGPDTIAGSAHSRLTVFVVLQRECDINIVAVKRQ